MRTKAIKRVLFSIATVSAFSAQAAELPAGLHLIDELPIEQRLAAHEAVLNYLNQHPEDAADAKVLAVDEKGDVYVLDENLARVADAGQPSCVGGCKRVFK
jgi:hypothetical protein